MVQLTITHDDGSTDTIDKTAGWTRQRTLGEMRRATINVERSLAAAASLEPKSDTVELGNIDTFRLVDVETGGSTWTLICYSFEWDANREAPTPGGDLREGDDQTLITNLVGEVSSWTAGTINSFTGALSFVFNHAHRHEALRRIERNVPGEIQFRDEGTVDHIDSLGSDKTGTVTLSAANGNIENEITITKRGRELDGTHFRVIGAHEGEAQLSANLVPADDPATYDNRVDYTTGRWSAGDTRDWDRWSNKDVTDQATLEEEAAALGGEITDPLVEAETTVVGEDLAVGDWVHVEKSDADLNRDMRTHRIKTVVDGAKEVDKVLLSTRTTVRKGDSHDLEDIQRFNTAFQGSAVWGTPSGGYQAVTSSDNYRLTFFYPDVNFEHTAELYVESTDYRTFHSGAAAGGDHTHTVDVTHPNHDHTVDISDTTDDNTEYGKLQEADFSASTISTDGTWKTIDTFTPTVHTSKVIVTVGTRPTADEPTSTPSIRLRNNDTGETVPVDSGHIYSQNVSTADADTIQFSQDISLIYNGDAYYDGMQVQIKDDGESYEARARWNAIGTHSHSFGVATTSGSELGTTQSETSDASGDHTHPVDPGVSNFPGTTASGVDVLVNGTTEATDIGSGTFQTTVDISGALDKGQFNTVELTSDSTGWLFASAGIEAYRQIGTQ